MNDEYVKSIGTDAPSRKKCTPPCHKPTLNENQQVVLDWLKDEINISDSTNALWSLLDDALEVDYDTDASEAWNRLPNDKKFQVLGAYAEWGMKEVAE